MKEYSPVTIKNPLSDNHIITVYPNQHFIVHLSAHNGEVVHETDSPYLVFESSNQMENGDRLIRYKQTKDFSNWTKIGKTFLGEVKIATEKNKDKFINLLVVLESNETTSDVITAINPNGELKLVPNQIVEVVIFGDKGIDSFEYAVQSANWDYHYIRCFDYTLEAGKTFESIESKHKFPQKLQRSFSVIRRSADVDIPEKHYWFECVYDEDKLNSVSEGVYEGGSLFFKSKPKIEKNPKENCLTILLNIKNKLKKTTLIQPRYGMSGNSDDYRDLPDLSFSRGNTKLHNSNNWSKPKPKDEYTWQEIELIETKQPTLDSKSWIFYDHEEMDKKIAESKATVVTYNHYMGGE